MLYEIIFSDEATRQLQKLEKEVQKRIVVTLERIRIRPEAYLKRLVGYPVYRLRVGDYRVIVDLDQDKLIILVIKIWYRKNIYE
ncbi:type II toxin-antitoxin system RelE/ParE family toxin [Candidatus Woesearchaeota archaeon]|nr:type II toxin-antitoxin system RelE/ParE family toxin [Candidatus Woesearchaeota archaeon]